MNILTQIVKIHRNSEIILQVKDMFMQVLAYMTVYQNIFTSLGRLQTFHFLGVIHQPISCHIFLHTILSR